MLHGSLVTLRPWAPDDLIALQELRNDINLQSQLMAKAKGSSIEQVKSWLCSRSSDPNSIFFVIADRENNSAVGYLQLIELDLFVGIGRLGICLCPGIQGRGFGSEALCLLEDYMQKMFSLRKILLEVLVSNEKAIRFYQRIGFRVVGHLHKHYRKSNDYEDVMIMEKVLSK